MKCLNPQVAYICGTRVSKDGVVSPHLVFSYAEALQYYVRIFATAAVAALERNEISVPCGKCAACAIRKRKDMTTRLTHEASVHDKCCFLTLTYDDDHVPVNNGDYTLVVSDVQRFMKRLRRHLEYIPHGKQSVGKVRDHVDHPIRYYVVGEYGTHTHRPHYHVIIFGWSPSDVAFWKQKGKVITYLSKQIQKLWPDGFSTVQQVSPYVAKYCARYVSKKFTTDWVPSISQLPEFILSSRRDGGIGAPWFDKFGESACKNNFVTYRCGDLICKATVPRYYWNRLRHRNQPLWIECRDERIEWIKQNPVVSPDKDFDDLVRRCECDAYDNNKRKENEVL